MHTPRLSLSLLHIINLGIPTQNCVEHITTSNVSTFIDVSVLDVPDSGVLGTQVS